MSKAAMHASGLHRVRPNAPMFDKRALVPTLACLYSAVVGPLIYFIFDPGRSLESIMESRWENRIFWPALAAITGVLVVRNLARFRRVSWPPHIICLLVYLAFAGASVLWAFKPQISFIRFLQEVMVLASIILPAMLLARSSDMMRGVFLCLALGAVLNVFFVFNNSEAFVNHLKGYPGYFSGKNALGEFAAIAFLVSLHETLYPLIRRSFGILILVIATVLLFYANSKTSLGLAFIVPCLAGLILVAARLTRISPAILLLFIPFFYIVLSVISGLSMNRVSFWIYGDPTFTGRTLIWDFANSEIARRPLLGWGYQSFWLVGLDGPSVVDAPGWIKNMPNAHNGYVDTKLELGYVGLALLITFILATLHAIGRVADRDRGRAWLLLSLALFVICYSFLESAWMRGYEFLWVMFVIVAAEAGRYWQPLPRASAMYRSVIRKQSSPHLSRVFLKPQ